jgi:membrane-associated phospholipid phosphatase
MDRVNHRSVLRQRHFRVRYVWCVDRRSKTLLAMAAGCMGLFALVVAGAYAWGPTESLDEAGFNGFVDLNGRTIHELSWRLTDFGNPATVAVITLVLAAVCLVRGRPRVALAVIGLVGATSISSELLKLLLAHPRYPSSLHYPVGPEALPSGHATAAMSLAMAGVLAAPRRGRLAAAVIGSALALGVGAAVIVVHWHYPSDVVAGYLLATGWALTAVAGLYEAERRYPARERWAGSTLARVSERVAIGGLALAALGVAILGLLVGAAAVLADPNHASCFARENTGFVVVAGGIASAALALPVAAATAHRR